jgi:hypothetical protein
MWSWLMHFIGAFPRTPSTTYNFWSGFGSDIIEFAIFGGIAKYYRQRNCHAKGCWRLGHHHVEGTPYKVCRRHHPTLSNTRNVPVAQIHDEHAQANGLITAASTYDAARATDV